MSHSWKPFGLFLRLRLRQAAGAPGRALGHFGLPALLLLFSGALFLRGHPFDRRALEVVGPDAAALAASLAAQPGVRVSLGDEEGRALARLRANAVQAVVAGGPRATVYVGAREELFGRGLAGVLPGGAALRVVEVSAGAYLRYLFPGLICWTILVNGLLGMGYGLAHDRNRRFLKKLSLTPLSRVTFVLAQIAGRALLSLGQLAVLVAVGWAVFDLPIEARGVLGLTAVTVLGLVVFCGLGFALAAAIPNEVTLIDTANAITVVLLLVSEVFFPIADLPRPVAAIAGALPSTHLVRALRHAVLPALAGGGQVAASLGMLAMWALVAYGVAVLTFRWAR